ncbi:MAG: ABC transporter ATP-binding protein [Cloacibacterium sp.]|jgi:Cu-processing system ATP-binding protein|nr:ABC transporter ATP-binding protein [Cloacibacterium sp.]
MIKIKNLTKKFNKFTALQNIDLECKKGHSIAFIGPNGCGKTTLIKCILGLNVVESGDILVNGNSVKNDFLYREKIGYMPQIGKYPENMTIGQTIKMIQDNRKNVENIDTELLEAFELPKLYDKKMSTLSGGTTQKVSAVLAFMFHPEIIILDEPTAGLDPLASEILKNKIIKERKNGKLIIITSHLLSELDDMVNEIVFINEGKILVHQSVEDLKTETQQTKISDAITNILKNMRNV